MGEEQKKPSFLDKVKEKWQQFKDWLADKIGRLCGWIVQNPDKAAAAVSMTIAGGKLALKAKRKHDETERLERRFYDRRSDTYSWSTRKLTTAEKRELEIRYRNGELKSDVLWEMGLLKK